MSATLHNIKNNYSTNFPSEVRIKATQGFVATAVISLLFGSALNVALVGGAIAATATLIEAITRPIMLAIFPEHEPITKVIQIAFSIFLAASLADWVGVSYRVTSPVITGIGLYILNIGSYDRKVGVVAVL